MNTRTLFQNILTNKNKYLNISMHSRIANSSFPLYYVSSLFFHEHHHSFDSKLFSFRSLPAPFKPPNPLFSSQIKSKPFDSSQIKSNSYQSKFNSKATNSWSSYPEKTFKIQKKTKSKSKKIYVCENCGEDFAQWWGKCRSCDSQGTLKEMYLDQTSTSGSGLGSGGGPVARVLDKIGPIVRTKSKNTKSGTYILGSESSNASELASESDNEVDSIWNSEPKTSVDSNGTFESGSERGMGRSTVSVVKRGGGMGIGSGRGMDFEQRRSGGWVEEEEEDMPQTLKQISKSSNSDYQRILLDGDDGKEISRVLGGGIVPGSLVLVGGDPGVGKSTLLLQMAGLLANKFEKEENVCCVLYVSGEESKYQVSDRAKRMKIKSEHLFLYSATNLEKILYMIKQTCPMAVIIDSIQTVHLPEATGSAGSTSQVRECATALLRTAKQSGIPIFLVGHVTKTGDFAGPRVLEHIVDAALYMEGESVLSHRLLRSVKNRYGATDEVGVFSMNECGLVPIINPSEIFLSERMTDGDDSSPAAVTVIMQGSRPLLIEIQALCTAVHVPPGRRVTNGIDPHRLNLLIAVMSKQGIALWKQDIFVNVVGGIQLKQPSCDLAIVAAIASSFYDKPISRDIAFIGEIGLHGEVRAVGHIERRIVEAAKLGFSSCFVPNRTKRHVNENASFKLVRCANIQDMIKLFFT